MKRREITESRWWEDAPTVTCYHGTSDALEEKILREGLRPPREIQDYCYEIIERLAPGTRISQKMALAIHQNTLSMRGGDRGRATYFHLNLQRAQGYATSYAIYGGEIAYTMYRMLTQQFKIPAKMFHPEGKPIVFETAVPREWLITYQNLDKIKSRLEHLWTTDERIKTRFPTKEAFFDDVADQFEVRVIHDIPPNYIIEVHHETGGKWE